MNLCPICHTRPDIFRNGIKTFGSSIEIAYKIRCPKCKFGCDEPGVVKLRYDTETMQPTCDDSDLRHLIGCWDYITGGAKEEKEN